MFVNASVSAVELVMVVVVVLISSVPGVITALKGRLGLFVVGFFVWLVWLWAPFRLAKPNSPWARRFYSAEKLEKARERFPEVDPADPDHSKFALTLGFGLLAGLLVAGVVAGATGS
ncbi:MAG TPA: hypothetical protein VHF90_02295 [Thermoleophilaceae bacterium]|nr:hypothetical protein [Thermoleophilaceae bacterium]